MEKNTGTIDRAVRIAIGVVLLILAYIYWASLGTVWGSLLVIIAAIALITGLVGMCPLYKLLGINSNK